MSVGDWLANTLSPDQQVREDATRKLESAAKENLPQYMMMLAQELLNEGSPSHVRSAAGIALKNALVGGDQERREQMTLQWLNMDMALKGQIKMAVLQALATPDTNAGTQAAQAVSAMAGIDLPQQQWPDLIEIMLNHVTGVSDTNLKKNTLMTIGFICENIEPKILESHSDAILTAVINGARKDELNAQVRRQAMKALYNSLGFIRNNFENREGERNFIMQVICENTQSKDVEIEVTAYECLSRIMHLYYNQMAMYMEAALCGITILGMQSENERVALQAVEFWSTVCDEEIEIQRDIEYEQELGQEPTQTCYNFAATVAKNLIQVLTLLLTKQEEDVDEDEWTVAMAAGTCLSLLAQCVKDPVLSHVLPFIELNLRQQDWRFRDAAVMAFGSILEGPDPKQLAPLVQQALPFLIGMAKDPSPQVKDTTAWTLGRICEYILADISLEILPEMVSSLIIGLDDSPRIATNCCWALMNLGEQLEAAEEATSSLSPYYESITTTLLRVSAREDNEGNVRSAAYQALSTMLTVASADCLPMIEKITTEIIGRLEATVQQQSQLLGMDDRNVHSELQANLCSALTSAIRHLGSKVHPVADRIMVTLLSILNASSKQSTVLEDAFLAIGAMCTALDVQFNRYLNSFTTFLYGALQNHEEHQLCAIAVGLVSDICRALNEQAAPYCDMFMNLLLADLQSPILHRDVKPVILGCFGDIALAIGAKFETYYEVVFHVLQQAAQMRIDDNSPNEMYDYILDLREGIIEAWIGIVQAFKAESRGDLIMGQVPFMFQIMREIGESINDAGASGEALIRGVAGLLGDLADTYKDGQIRAFTSEPWVENFLNLVIKGRTASPTTRQIAKWARDTIRSNK